MEDNRQVIEKSLNKPTKMQTQLSLRTMFHL